MPTPSDGSGAMTRRQMLRSGVARIGLPVLGLPLAACAGGLRLPTAAGAQAALLLPLSGPGQAVGENMARAARIAVEGRAAAAPLPTFDTQDTAEGAAAAARAALDGGARMLLGPLRAEQTPAVLAVAGAVPVVTFSNDERLAGQGAFVLGVTPQQSAAVILSYVQAQGLRRVAVAARDTAFGRASAEAVRLLAASAGVTVTALALREPTAPGLAAALRDGAGSPDAVYLPEGGETLAAFARGLRGSGAQILGSIQWGLGDVADNPDLAGAWFAAAPPDLFMPFSERFAAAYGGPPGVIAALGHDAALMATALAEVRALNRGGLIRPGGFTGVLGAFRFLPDGRCARDLVVVTVNGGAYALLAEVSG
jgi:ABC-type branched-subunit amino acid transport system substrate-binding protein